jgi:hypothetical protein
MAPDDAAGKHWGIFGESKTWARETSITLFMAMDLLIALQILQVAVLWLHDWVPLGRLNDVRGVQAEDTQARLIRVTLIQSLPFTLGLVVSLIYSQVQHPFWVWAYLWVSHLLLFAGEVRAWWFPYLVQAEPARAARYAKMFGATHTFLPVHNAMAPNTLHCLLHAATLLTLLTLTAHAMRWCP